MLLLKVDNKPKGNPFSQKKKNPKGNPYEEQSNIRTSERLTHLHEDHGVIIISFTKILQILLHKSNKLTLLPIKKIKKKLIQSSFIIMLFIVSF